ncbi:hypothetical protein F2Q69_00041977 [Brassica cretica]|uniref:Uncharacterized protein n=1 Tax=Brassica cretica TaxID=69181 RepID=A0A8S9NMZ6_BRACR|nr:hypothetical protein F2Q69_00041977 [Brassica cretica]
MQAMTSVDFENSFIFVFFSTFVLFFFLFFFKKQKNVFGLHPSPPYLPIIGHLHLLFSASIHTLFQKNSSSVSSNGPIGIDECLVFGAYGFIKAPYGDYWKFMKKGITTNMLGPQAMERSRGVRAVEIEYGNLLDKAMKKHSIKTR